MTRLGQMLYDDGMKEGIKEGGDKMATLIKVLLAADKASELQLALDDSEYREKLMKKYGIE